MRKTFFVALIIFFLWDPKWKSISHTSENSMSVIFCETQIRAYTNIRTYIQACIYCILLSYSRQQFHQRRNIQKKLKVYCAFLLSNSFLEVKTKIVWSSRDGLLRVHIRIRHLFNDRSEKIMIKKQCIYIQIARREIHFYIHILGTFI